LQRAKALLPVREFKPDRVTGGAEASIYLEMASYVKHEGREPTNNHMAAGLSNSCEILEGNEYVGSGLSYFA
jgi:hypothetical protein